MKKYLALFLTLALLGCAQLQAIPDLLKPRPNPVTKQMLYEAENALVIAVSGLTVYKKLCVQKAIDQSCRSKVANLQVYTRKAAPVLKSLRKFVKENDQVSAGTAYQTLTQIIADLKLQTPTVEVQ